MGVKHCILIILTIWLLFACSEKVITNSKLNTDNIMDCPSSPNCVSSQASDSKKQVDPFQLKPIIEENWEKVKTHINAMPRTQIISDSDTMVHVECKSRIFRFADDLELRLDAMTGKIDVRSASRVGYSDFGVNKRRVQTLKEELQQQNIIY